jgi:glutathione S-transferase
MSAPQTKIDLYTSGTPNGQKSSILLEELGLQYTTHAINLSKNEQKESWYLEKVNPNGRIPALIDNTPVRPIRIFESGALILYLCERYDTEKKISFEYDSEEYWEALSWHVWMQSGLGPMQGNIRISCARRIIDLTYVKDRQIISTDTRLRRSSTGLKDIKQRRNGYIRY